MKYTVIFCAKCKTRDADGYIKNGFSGKTRRYYCRKCNRERFKKYYHAHKEKVRAIIYKSVKKHWEKQQARVLLNRQVVSGKLKKPKNCSTCNKRGRIEAHHTDYEKPLEVVWLCSGCHADADRLVVH